MPLRVRASRKWFDFAIPVSYNINETENRLSDALNVFVNQKRLETRYGESKLTPDSLGGKILSSSFFKDNDANRSIFAKVGQKLNKVSTDGSFEEVLTGLTASTKHRGLTLNNRHILALQNDGLKQFNGTEITQLGQAAPLSYTAAKNEGGGTLTDGTYRVKLSFYDSTNGFESNAGDATSGVVAAGSDDSITVSNIPIVADNANIDKVRVYASLGSADFLFMDEIDLGTATYEIIADTSSAQTPQTKHAPPIAGGGKYLTEFGGQLVYSGNNTYPNDVFFSEENIPDGFDDTSTAFKLFASGQGPVTGLATAFYNDSNLLPYLIIFKENSFEVYSKLNNDGSGSKTKISDAGCISNETIFVKGKNIYFLSKSGWRVISNGQLVEKDSKPFSLGNAEIDDIFKRDGFEYRINDTELSSAFSVNYEKLGHYITFMAPSGSTNINRGYNFQFEILGFHPYKFIQNLTSAVNGEDSLGREVVYLTDDRGHIYTHSIHENRADEQNDGTLLSIPAMIALIWIQGDDFDATYNFRNLIVRGIASESSITLTSYTDYSRDYPVTYSIDFDQDGAVFDTALFDTARFADSKAIIVGPIDLNRYGQNLLIKFDQDVLNTNIGLVQMQLDFSKNGNRN